MKVLIIEDEMVAAQQLSRLLSEVAPEAEVLSVLQSIEESVEWFQQSHDIDLVFMDIHLADGSAFRIFDQVSVEVPIIFTTAYDQYALQAFKVNSIDYLLKPINLTDLQRALKKFDQLSTGPQGDIAALVEMMRQQNRHYKTHFLIPVSDRLVPLSVEDIAYIWLDSKVSQCVTSKGETFALNMPLDTLMEQLDPRNFYRVNRQCIVAHKAIADIHIWIWGKLKLNLCIDTKEPLIIPKAKVAEFKNWYVR